MVLHSQFVKFTSPVLPKSTYINKLTKIRLLSLLRTNYFRAQLRSPQGCTVQEYVGPLDQWPYHFFRALGQNGPKWPIASMGQINIGLYSMGQI